MSRAAHRPLPSEHASRASAEADGVPVDDTAGERAANAIPPAPPPLVVLGTYDDTRTTLAGAFAPRFLHSLRA